MEKLKIAFFEIEPGEADYLKSKLKRFDLLFSGEKLNPQTLKKTSGADVFSIFIYSSVDKNILGLAKNLKFIATRSTGFDHINLKECGKRNILVSNVPTYGENTVAEHTFALILALSRKICASYERTKKDDFSLDGLRGFDLAGKTLGVVGIGTIGRDVINLARCFGMEVLAFDVKKDLAFAKRVRFKYVTLDYLFGNSDIVTLHVPHNPATHHLVNLKSLKLFKKRCYLINTSRGEVCDTSALLAGLKDGIFAGLGLDVLEGEGFIKEEWELLNAAFKKTRDLKITLQNHMLISHPNVIVTPHNAFNSVEALQRILNATAENIIAFSKNKPINLVRWPSG